LESRASRIEGSVSVKNQVQLEDAYVQGDLRARTVELFKNSGVAGTIYYVDEFKAHKDAKYGDVVRVDLEDL